MSPRGSLHELAAERRRESDDDGERLVDLRLDVLDQETGDVLLSVGGRWDRRAEDYIGEGDKSRVLHAHPGQREFVDWYDGWLGDHIEGTEIPEDQRIYSALLAGGQRAGKSQIGICVASVAYALACPGAIVWIVCPSDRDTEEVADYLEATMPKAWYRKLGTPWFRYTLINGSKIVMRSGHTAQGLKKGRADLIVLNEAQRMKESVWAICRARIADRGGVVIATANPPDSAMGAWVGDWVVEAEAGLRQSRYFYFDPFENPYIDHGPLLALRAELDDRTYEIEVLGKFLSASGTVLHNWDRRVNEQAVPPDAVDITRQFTRRFEKREFDRVVAVDVQKTPMASVEFKFFQNPLARSGPELFQWCHQWATQEIIIENADEFELAQAWLDAGWDPERTLIVCDASAEWQFAERDPKKVGALRKQVKGRGSFDVFDQMGFKHIVKPDRRSEANPDVVERCRASTARIRLAAAGPYGRHFLFSVPTNKKLNRSIRNWPNKHGVPSRVSKHAHACDAFTYGVQRFYARRTKKRKPRYEGGSRSLSSHEEELGDIT